MKLDTVITTLLSAAIVGALIYGYVVIPTENYAAAYGKARQLVTGELYAWQEDCDSRCAKIIGEEQMAEIDNATCRELIVITFWGAESDIGKAARDKMVSMPDCDLSRTGSYGF